MNDEIANNSHLSAVEGVIASTSEKTAPPSWLQERMEALRQLPPPTLQEVETSFRAAEEARRKYVANPSNYTNGR